jgi:hypothetical protein
MPAHELGSFQYGIVALHDNDFTIANFTDRHDDLRYF